MTQQVNKRQFSVSPHIIYSLIKAQAGSLGKGLLECIMNSVDAGATRIDIELTPTRLTVTDDGKGFVTRGDIEACFEVFGFEHKDGERKYGQFGIGRAQLWNFCSTVWHTNQFTMDVDIKNKGLDYDLTENVTPVKGLRIEGTLYEPLLSSDIWTCESELKELATYVDIPVTFNGQRISMDPSTEKWNQETDDAWIRTSNVSSKLVVYNLGVKVREYPSSYFGLGGLVVTKPGVRLSLNMARNDILLAECSVWKRIKPFLQKKGDEVVKRTSRLTEEQMENMGVRFLSGSLPYAELSERKLIQDVMGKKYTLDEFYARVWKTLDNAVTFVPDGEASPAAEETHKRGDCFVLTQKSLRRFGARNLTALMDNLAQAGERYAPEAHRNWLKLRTWGQQETIKVEETWKKACHRISDGHMEIPRKEWTPRERAAISALTCRYWGVVSVLARSGASETQLAIRDLRIGVSEVAEAWTDGTSSITLNRDVLKRLDDGLAGAVNLVHLLAHEYLHEGPSTGTHVHDEEFHERFHRAVTHYDNYATMGAVAASVLVAYAKACRANKVAIKRKVVLASNELEAYSVEVPEEATPESSAA